MALQLTPMMGATAFPDRMGDYYPTLLNTGQIVQGYNLNGWMTDTTIAAINHDISDPKWRDIFHRALKNDSRFQRGLFPEDQKPTEPLVANEMEWEKKPFHVEAVQALAQHRQEGTEAIDFEYGWALIKTAASLVYTTQLCQEFDLVAATDSTCHFHLLEQTFKREQIVLTNFCLKREGY